MPLKKILLFILYLLIVVNIAVYSVYKADYNWDVLAYIGIVYSLETSDTSIVHQKTFEEFKKSADEKTYLQLTTGNKYREAMFTCAKCFYQQLPFYKIKPLYIFLIYTLYKLNVNIALASLIISGLFYFLTCVIICLWLLKISGNEFYIFLIAVLISLFPFLLNSASAATPDALSGFIILLAVFFLLVKRSLYLYSILMVLSLFARPDNIFLFAILSGVLLSSKIFVQKRMTIYLSVLAGILSVLIINIWSGYYGYSTLYQHLVERLITPAEYKPEFTLSMYFKGLLGWIFLLKYSMFAIQFVILLLAMYIKYQLLDKPKEDLEFLLLIAMASSIILHYIIFPMMDDRFFIAHYIVIDLIFIKTVYGKAYEGTLNKVRM